MALTSMRTLLSHAQANHYAVGYFESWNLESIHSVIAAAERTRSPVIIGVSGMFLGNGARRVQEDIYHYGALCRTIAARSNIPAAVLLNEAHDVSMLINGLAAGFNAIMHQDPACSFEETIQINQYIVRTAHYLGADVEAEVGQLPNADISTESCSQGELTDPDKAAYFVDQTQVDALAVAVGNIHLLETGKSVLDFDLLERIKKKVHVPLVLHGGTGVSPDDLRQAIALGMCKVNVGTSLKRTFINSVYGSLVLDDFAKKDPHDLIGKGGSADILVRAREAMTEEIIRYMKVFGSENQANTW